MSDTAIFIVGLFIFVLFSGGLTFSVVEIQRLGKEGAAKSPFKDREASSPSPGSQD